MDGTLIYNITFKIDKKVSKEWLSRMKTTYLPACHSDYKAQNAQINEIIIDNEDGDMSYALQLSFNTVDEYHTIIQPYLHTLVLKIENDFSNQIVYFGTMMKVVHSMGNRQGSFE